MWPYDIHQADPSHASQGRSCTVTASLAPLLAVGIPRLLFYACSAIVLAICFVGHCRTERRYRRFVSETEARLRRLEQRADEYEQQLDAEVARMRAELDAHGAWSEANDRFFHHGLVAVSHLLGAKALPTRRACATERRGAHEQRAAATAWRPKPTRTANRPSNVDQAMRVQRRTCT